VVADTFPVEAAHTALAADHRTESVVALHIAPELDVEHSVHTGFAVHWVAVHNEPAAVQIHTEPVAVRHTERAVDLHTEPVPVDRYSSSTTAIQSVSPSPDHTRSSPEVAADTAFVADDHNSVMVPPAVPDTNCPFFEFLHIASAAVPVGDDRTATRTAMWLSVAHRHTDPVVIGESVTSDGSVEGVAEAQVEIAEFVPFGLVVA